MNAGDVKVRLVADLKRFSGNMTKASGLVRGFARIGTKSVGLLTRSMRSLTGLPALGLGAAFAGAVHQMASFEEQMASVSTMLDEQSMRYMPRYNKAVRQMSAEFGESTSTISRGLYQILSASVAPEKALGLLEVSLKAAKAGMTDTETAADTLTTMLNAYGYEAEYAGLMSDRLFGIVKRGKTTFPELASSLGNVASAASLVKMDVEMVGAALATMTRSGLSTSEAVTSLNRLLTTFNKPKAAAEGIAKEFGVQLEAASVSGGKLIDVLRKLTAASPKQLASLASRETAYKALAIMTQNLAGVEKDYLGLLKSAGSTQEQYVKMVDTLMHRLKQMWQVMKIVAIDAVRPLSDDLKKMFDWLTDHQEGMSKFATKLGAYLKYAKDMFVAFVTLMQESPQAGFEALLDSLLIVIKEAGKLAVDMAIRIGKGIWAGVKEGVMGENMEGLEERTRQLYEGRLRQQANPPEPYRDSFKTVGFGAVPVQEPSFPEEYQEAERAAAGQLRGEKTDSLFEGLGDSWKGSFAQASSAIRATWKNTTEQMARDMDSAAAQLNATLAGVEGAAGDASYAVESLLRSTSDLIDEDMDNTIAVKEALERFAASSGSPLKSTSEMIDADMDRAVAGLAEANDASDKLLLTFPKMAEAAAGADEAMNEAALAVQQYVAQLWGEVEVLAMVAHGHAAEAARQQVVNEFKQQGIDLNEDQLDQIQRLIDAQKSLEAVQAVREYVQELQQEAEVLDLVAQGHTAEAAHQQVLNNFKQQGIELTESQIDQIKRLGDAHRSAEAAQTVQEYVDRLQDEVDVIGLLVGGYKEAAREQKVLNEFKGQGIALNDEQLDQIQQLEQARARAEAAQTIQEHVDSLQGEVDVLRLLAAGYNAEARQQEMLNEFKEQGIALTETQIQQIEKLERAKNQAEATRTVQEYVDSLQDEVDVLRLLASGYASEAERLQIVNDFKRQGIDLTVEQVTQIQALIAKQKELTAQIEADKAPSTWASMWENAASAIDGAMSDAFVSITKNVNNATEALENMLDAMQEAISRSVFEQLLMPGINRGIGSMLGVPGFGADVTNAPTVQQGTFTSGVDPAGEMRFSRGGLVKGYASGGLVYASRGMFTPRGTDTVPAMLTPGEGVLDKDLTAKLRKTLQVPDPSPVASRPVNINISAIDAAGTYQFLQKHKRALASMMGTSAQTNHPSTRGTR